MSYDTDVLIIGAGPTGLMLACQLLRFGVSFRIIDAHPNRAYESRAFAIQAKSMEIFQNLGIVSEFLEQAQTGMHAYIYASGKPVAELSFKDVATENTPYPSIFFISQSITEQILLNYIQKQNVQVEQQTKLLSFSQTDDAIEATITNQQSKIIENCRCRYIVGCDGAHSTVRHALAIPFEGAAYKQEFILADATLEWPLKRDKGFMAFFDKTGVFIHVQLNNNTSRVMGARIGKENNSNDAPPTVNEIEELGKAITHTNIKLSNVAWMSRFHLHHRAVKQYQEGRAFLAGDAAHIHSPVGGQGMNTGIQDATNLAWKLAFVINKKAPEELLSTYNIERQRVGEVLVKTTDRIFGFMTSTDFFTSIFRLFLLPIIFKLIGKIVFLQKKMFHFISQLGIHYQPNAFVYENTTNADAMFLSGPKAGYRAPDAPIKHTSLFEIFSNTPCNILIFSAKHEITSDVENKIKNLERLDKTWFAIHKFQKSAETEIIFSRYSISSSGIFFIRPDGYIGFRVFGMDIDGVLEYINKFKTYTAKLM